MTCLKGRGMMKSIVTKHTNLCLICNSPVNDTHHLVMGNSRRKLADEDGLVVPLCRLCHDEIHKKSYVAAEFSRICGQLAYEKHLIATEGVTEDEARDRFRQRYGKSFI